jgi:hypothetical protein
MPSGEDRPPKMPISEASAFASSSSLMPLAARSRQRAAAPAMPHVAARKPAMRSPDLSRTAASGRRLKRASQRAHLPAKYPQGAGAASTRLLTTGKGELSEVTFIQRLLRVAGNLLRRAAARRTIRPRYLLGILRITFSTCLHGGDDQRSGPAGYAPRDGFAVSASAQFGPLILKAFFVA